MDTAKTSTRPVFVRVLLFNVLAALCVAGAAYWGLRTGTVRIARLVQTHAEITEIKSLADWMAAISSGFWPWFLPSVILFFFLVALLTWLSLRRTCTSVAAPAPVKRPAPSSKEAEEKAAKQRADAAKRTYLHLIGILQKEGRLLDFFSEDLSQYQDGQIGAAVRSIHENCKKSLDGQIKPQFVLDAQEGDEIEVEKGFDPNTLKLVGNVTGEPPFKGIVRHRGWRARKVDLPTFSGRQATDIIAPAEVEVQ